MEDTTPEGRIYLEWAEADEQATAMRAALMLVALVSFALLALVGAGAVRSEAATPEVPGLPSGIPQAALNPESKRFRNFLGFDRRWLEVVGSEDSHGRALWALGTLVGRARRPGLPAVAAPHF